MTITISTSQKDQVLDITDLLEEKVTLHGRRCGYARGFFSSTSKA